jgi:hypothetical protein
MTEMLATPANMRKLRHIDYRAPAAVVFAYSPRTYERYSATPGDYWHMADDEPLLDENGEPMVLAFEHTTITIVEDA